MHTLIDARPRLEQANRRPALIFPEGPVLRILKLTRVDRSLEIYPSRSAAHFAT